MRVQERVQECPGKGKFFDSESRELVEITKQFVRTPAALFLSSESCVLSRRVGERKAEVTTAHHRLRHLPEVPATLESAQ